MDKKEICECIGKEDEHLLDQLKQLKKAYQQIQADEPINFEKIELATTEYKSTKGHFLVICRVAACFLLAVSTSVIFVLRNWGRSALKEDTALALVQAPPALEAHTPPALEAHTPPALEAHTPPALEAHTPPALEAHSPPALEAHSPPASPRNHRRHAASIYKTVTLPKMESVLKIKLQRNMNQLTRFKQKPMTKRTTSKSSNRRLVLKSTMKHKKSRFGFQQLKKKADRVFCQSC